MVFWNLSWIFFSSRRINNSQNFGAKLKNVIFFNKKKKPWKAHKLLDEHATPMNVYQKKKRTHACEQGYKKKRMGGGAGPEERLQSIQNYLRKFLKWFWMVRKCPYRRWMELIFCKDFKQNVLNKMNGFDYLCWTLEGPKSAMYTMSVPKLLYQ